MATFYCANAEVYAIVSFAYAEGIVFDMTFDFLRYLGVGRCICSHVVKPLCQVYVLWHPMAQLVHVAKVEHGLSVILLLRSDPVVERGCLKVDIRP